MPTDTMNRKGLVLSALHADIAYLHCTTPLHAWTEIVLTVIIEGYIFSIPTMIY